VVFCIAVVLLGAGIFLFALHPQLKAGREEHAKATAEFEQKSGVNAAGQDVSNIPPEQTKTPEQIQCLKAHIESLPPEERGAEEQRITRVANERGVARTEVVGC